MELPRLFDDFNHSKFIVHLSLFFFVFFFSLRLDETIQWSWWIVFLPIWSWKILVFLGAAIGTFVWLKNPQSRMDAEGVSQFRAMWLTVTVHCFLFLFELFACEQLVQPTHRWILVFLPLNFVSLLSFFVCIWSVKRERPFELEMFCAANLVQFIFLALRLDEIITWSWGVVFIPLWILMGFFVIGVVYSIIFACLVMRSTHHIAQEQRWIALRSAFTSTIVVLPLLASEVLFVYRLDGLAHISFLICSVPLLVALTNLMFMACGSRGGNKSGFFGIRKDFCQSLLASCPCLREYGNIKIGPDSNKRPVNPDDESALMNEATVWERKMDPVKYAKFAQTTVVVAPCLPLESPD
ncbi:hypothetical protein RvY_02294 [Ramazzottius varieornatus]|uniref:Transmembrane protein 185B n=1 Tax=Ramazzottius varieornatus TaxID=947166 RepID=A0A1D1UTS9_RAMVA|nr:hypothetical protein RvY_02294 [Ramazzottius varieornatus]